MSSKKSLILIHGWGASPQIWLPLLDLLDLKHYDSVLNLTIHEFLNFKPIDTQRYDLIGWSLGGILAIHHTLNYKNHVDKLILINSTACFDNPAFDQFSEQFASNPKATLKQFHLLQVKNDQHYRTVFKYLTQQTEHHTDYLHLLDEYDLRDQIHLIQQDTLLIHGEQDQVISYFDSLDLHEKLPNSQCVLFKSAGHVAFLSELTQSADLIQSFLNRSSK